MTPEAFRARLARLGLSQVGAARALNIDPRTVRRYCSGALPITRLVELALSGLKVSTPTPPGTEDGRKTVRTT
jgi:plasmid maintenance system antidote protein VapI